MNDFDVQSDPGIAIFYEGKIGDDRGFRFQTVLPRDCSAKELNHLVDKLRVAADRQQAFYSADAHAANIEKSMKLLEHTQAEIRRVSERYVREWHERGKFGAPELSQPEKDSLANLEASLKTNQNEILKWQQALEIAKRKIDGHATQ